jgi:hypothetical protein
VHSAATARRAHDAGNYGRPLERVVRLTNVIDYPQDGSYSGYGDGYGTHLADFASSEMIADWEANREELLQFWHSGKPNLVCFPAGFFPPRLYFKGNPKTRPWAAEQFGKEGV